MNFKALNLSLQDIRVLFEAKVTRYFDDHVSPGSDNKQVIEQYVLYQWPYVEAYLTRGGALGANVSDLTCVFAINFTRDTL